MRATKQSKVESSKSKASCAGLWPSTLDFQAPARSVLSLLFAALLAPALSAETPENKPSPYGIEALSKRRVQLFVMSGQEPLKDMAGNVYGFATDSEHCRVISGSRACGLSPNPLPGASLEQVFDYYVRGPINASVGQQQPSVHKQDWNWEPNSTPGRKPGD
jgi:hypothetical protein